MQNIAEFQIIGRIGEIKRNEKVTYISVASNYGYYNDDKDYVKDPHWNQVTLFGKVAERTSKMTKGDMVHVRGRVRQNSFEKDGQTKFGVDLIADGIARLAKAGEGNDDHEG
jgi:single-strand DNA-binding protein